MDITYTLWARGQLNNQHYASDSLFVWTYWKFQRGRFMGELLMLGAGCRREDREEVRLAFRDDRGTLGGNGY